MGNFAEEFSRLASALRLSNKELAKIIGTTPSFVARWKTGEKEPHWMGQAIILQDLEKRLK